jgi:hypothetical protein
MGSEAGWPPGLAGLGIAAGLVMTAGLATLPGIVMGLDVRIGSAMSRLGRAIIGATHSRHVNPETKSRA